MSGSEGQPAAEGRPGVASDILERILAVKREEVVALAQRFSLPELEARAEAADAPRGFCGALSARTRQGPAVIAEIKRASPSKGLIRTDFDAAWLARSYTAGGAAALSVLTDRQFFQGDEDCLRAARGACSLPVLRKDFLIDVRQVLEARAMAADCVLLIAAALSPAQIQELAQLSHRLGMDVLVEVHDAAELEQVLATELPLGWLLGINNRNLRSFETRLDVTLELLEQVPAGVDVVTESGLAAPADIQRMLCAGVRRFLIGESLMRAGDPGQRLGALIAGPDADAEGAWLWQ